MIRSFPAKKSGFTLVELLVAVSIFSVIVVSASAVLVAEIGRERRVRQESQLQKNIYTFLQNLEREVQTANRIGCENVGQDCPAGGSVLAVELSGGEVVEYTLSNDRVVRLLDGGGGQTALSPGAGAVTNLRVYVDGASPGDAEQQTALIAIEANLTPGGQIFRGFRYVTPQSLDIQ